MGEPLTADDVLPLVARLSPAERVRLCRLIAAASQDIEVYRVAQPCLDEFSSDDEALAWDANGWENFE